MQIYKEQSITLASGESTSRSGVFSFVSILENSVSSDISIAFGRDGEYYEIPKGLSIELPKEVTFVRFKNNSLSSMTFRVAFTAGRIYDNRLVLDSSTPIQVEPSGTALPVSVSNQGFADITTEFNIEDGGDVNLPLKKGSKINFIKNTGITDILFAPDDDSPIRIAPNETLNCQLISVNGEDYIYNDASSTYARCVVGYSY